MREEGGRVGRVREDNVEVEGRLLELPQVADAAVLGVPHERMGEAYQALGRLPEASLEFEVAAAVQPDADRAYMSPGAEKPAADSDEELRTRSRLRLRAAKLRHEVGDAERRDNLLERVLQESRTSGLTEIESEVIDLQQKWRGK